MFSGKSVPSIMSPTAASVRPGWVGGDIGGVAGTSAGAGAAAGPGGAAGGCVAQAASSVSNAAPAEIRGAMSAASN